VSDADPDGEVAPADGRPEVDLLREENRRLRERVREARRSRYRRTARWLAVVGGIAAGAAALFPTVRRTLLVLAGIGFFAAVLTRLVTPERFVAADTAEAVNWAWRRSTDEMAAQLDLAERRVYVPVEGTPSARLFLPVSREYELPERAALSNPLVVDVPAGRRGLSLVPAGASLFDEFERSLAEPLGDTAPSVTDQVADALVNGFELADRVERDCDAESGRATVTIHGAAYGGDGTDGPLGSFVAVTLARALESPVELEVVDREASRVVTCRWDPEPEG